MFLLNKSVLFIMTIALFVNVQQSWGLRILGLFPFHAYSHFIICEELMRELAAKGHQVDVYSHFPQNKPLPNYTDFSLKGTLPAILNNLTLDEISFNESPVEMFEHWLAYGKPVCELLGHPLLQKLFHDPPKDQAYDVVIIEICLFDCFIALGNQLNVPIVGVVPSPMLDWHCDPLGAPMNLATDPSVLSHYVAPMTFFERLGNFYIYHTVNRAFIKYSKEQDELVEKYLGPGFPSTADMLRELSLVLVNHHVGISGARFFPSNVIPVPGLHVVDHNETLLPVVQKWLDESTNGCIYFSLGSMIRIESFPKHILNAFYKSFENIKHVRVLLKVAKPEELPSGLPSNVLVQSWVQQKQVLKHKNVKAFVTHCGYMGTQEAIYYGVPLVAVPLFGDQYFNAKAYAKKKIAVYIEVQEITEKSFTHALKEVLSNPTYMKTVKKLSSEFKDRPLTPSQTALFWIEYVVRHGKDALRSRTVVMPWWQVSLIDVYAFIASIILLVLYGTIKILKLVSRLILMHINGDVKIKKN